MNKEIEKIKDCIDSVYGSDCAYYGVDGLAIAAALYKAGCRFQSEKILVKENGDIVPITPRSEWISVEERLPDREGKYLVYTWKGYIMFSNFCDYCLDGDLCFDNYNVTHWMPLPEAPKMKGGAE